MSEREHREQRYRDLFAAAGEAGFQEAARKLALNDLYFLMVWLLGRKDMRHDWLFDRCMEVQAEPDGFLDLWSREHYKSTIITFGKTCIQDVLRDPEITIGIFSHTSGIAKSFLRQVKHEFEQNRLLQQLFPDVLWANPQKDAPSWSVQNGITVQRKSNPKEATIEAHGLVDGQPTSRHFRILLYDDVVTRESVYTSEQIQRVTEAWELSLNLGAHGGVRRTIGTRYHFNDTYKVMMDRGSAKPRIYPATAEGTVDGTPVLLTTDQLQQKRRDMGPYTFACQMMQNPKADSANGFQEDWLRYYDPSSFTVSGLNIYLLCDPASEKKKDSDYTAMGVIGLGPDQNYYLIDAIRDRLNLTQRTRKLMEFHRRYRPIAVGYEKYGKDSDIEHIQSEQQRQNYRFEIIPLGGSMPKPDRIRRLVPVFEQGRWWMPWKLHFLDYEQRVRDYTAEFVRDEYLPFPVALHDDCLDMQARILDQDLGAVFPDPSDDERPDTADMDFDLFGG